MNKRIRALLCVLLSCITIFGSLTVANAATGGGNTAVPLSSNFFWGTQASLSPLGSGKVRIEADARGTETMAKVGVASIVLWEKKPGQTSFSIAKTYVWGNTENMTATDTADHYLKLTYCGIPGAQYYASVSFYALKYSGASETPSYVTKTITAY